MKSCRYVVIFATEREEEKKSALMFLYPSAVLLSPAGFDMCKEKEAVVKGKGGEEEVQENVCNKEEGSSSSSLSSLFLLGTASFILFAADRC